MSKQATWVNAKLEPSIKDRGYNSAELRTSDCELRLAVRPAPWTFMIGFACLFLPAFVALVWLTTEDPAQRWFGVIAGPILFCLVCGLMFWLQSCNEKLGDYLVMERARRLLRLPRIDRKFSFDQIVGFQTIRGRTKRDSDVDVDLNLLVSEGGEIVRYYVMSNPSQQLVDEVVAYAGAKLDQIDLGRRGYRDADRYDSEQVV